MIRYAFVATLALSAAVAASAIMPAAAQKYPSRPIKLIVPFPPGGGNDLIARPLAAQAEQQVGQAIVIDNRGGANGIIGTQAVANAEPDGYTLLHVSSSFSINNAVYKKLPYDIFKDFAPIANVARGAGYIVVVNAKLPIKTTRELIDYAKKNDIFYGNSGNGNPIHLATESFKVAAGIDMKSVPFRGTAPGLTALISGDVQVMIVPIGAAMPYIQGGQLRAVGFTGDKRSAELPDVPTIGETLPGYSFTGVWHAWLAPAKTPKPVIDYLNAEVRKAAHVPKVAEAMRLVGYEPDDTTPEQHAEFLKKDAAQMLEAVRAAKIEPQ
jgi:tripartite-type tricarboxylate transporter receptor subunit TctC